MQVAGSGVSASSLSSRAKDLSPTVSAEPATVRVVLEASDCIELWSSLTTAYGEILPTIHSVRMKTGIVCTVTP